MKRTLLRMKRWGSVGLLGLLLAAAIMLPHTGTRAWSGDSTENTVICSQRGNQSNPQIISDGSGGAIITWQDYRSGTDWDIYAQRLDSNGVAQWTTDGVAVCTASEGQSEPQLASDGSGGAIITWWDYRSGTDYDIYAQRVGSNGVVQWTANGVAICTASNWQCGFQIISDVSGGAIITWEDFRTGFSPVRVYVQKVDSSGATQWTTDGVAACPATTGQSNPQIVSDGSGGAIITWDDHRSTYYTDIYAQRVDSSGAIQWNADAVAICTASGWQSDSQITSDGSGGAIVTWEDNGYDDYCDVYAQKVDSGGAVQWVADGVAICTASDDQYYPQIVSDGSGGAIITWQDERSATDVDIYAQRVGSGGAAQWAANGVAICAASDTQKFPRIVSDGSGGAIATWQDYRIDPKSDIYAQRVGSGGTTQWTTDGVAISTASDHQYYPQIVSGGSGGAIITWQDYRNGGSDDIYAQKVESTGTLPDTIPPTVTFSSTATSPTNTSPIPMTAAFSEPVTGFTVGDIVVGNGSAGSFAGSGSSYTFSVTPSGQGTVTLNVGAGVAHDAAGNGNTAATQFSITFDSIAPTVTLSSTATSPTSTSPIPMTATFSEDVTGFVLGDIVVGNGTAGNLIPFNASVYNFSVTPAGQGVITVDVAGGVAHDAANNGNTALATQFSITFDSDDPTVTLTSTTTSPTNTSPIPMTATFSEDVTGFALGDIVVGNGTVSGFEAVTPAEYIFSITPNGEGIVTVNVAAGVAQDGTGHDNSAAAQYSITYDSISPSVTISSTAISPTRNSPIPMTATFSEDVTEFTVDGISVVNGSVSHFETVSAAEYIFNVTPNGQGVVTVYMPEGVAADAAGNGNSAADQFNITYDSIAPTVTLTSTTTSPTNTSPIPMTATFSEDVSEFTMGGITVGNGYVSSFEAVSASVYTFNVAPGGKGAVTISMPDGVAADAAGNGNSAADPFSIMYDPLAPTVTLTSTATSPTNTSPIPITATFSEDVTGFVPGDISVGNGFIVSFEAVSASVYTFDVTPAEQGVVTVDVAGGSAQNAAESGNIAADQFTIVYDSVAPTVTLTSTATSPTSTSPIPMTATFSDPVTSFSVDDITVGNGSVSGFVAVNSTAYTFDVTPGSQSVITVDVAAGRAADAAGNGNSAADQFSITYAHDSQAPTVTLTSTATPPTSTSPIPVTATFSEPVTGFTADDITVGNGSVSNFVAVNSTVYTFDVTPSGQGVVTVDVAAGVAQNAAGTGNAAADQFTIIYDGPPIQIPTIASFSSTSTTDDGHVVIIIGTNFTGATSVKCGDTDALSFEVDSATQITAVVGFGASGKISVTTPGGTATSDDDFTSSKPGAGSGKVWLIGVIVGVVLVLAAIASWLVVSRRRATR
ncbi:MAG: hypothetical protein JW753_03330 [Dehalococcoidia bacterium]|nr:hypothetical protein [Dehalococcoidia bacterium]